jgi:hypothetical protein
MTSEQMRGIARSDFAAPADMRVPAALRPWTSGTIAQAPAPHSDAGG